MWVRPTTTGPVRSRSQVMQMPTGDSTMPSSLSFWYVERLSPSNMSAASAWALAKAPCTRRFVSGERTTRKFQGCMKPTEGAWCAAVRMRLKTSSGTGVGRNWPRTSRREKMAW